MGGCSSKSMLKNVEEDVDLVPLPMPENQVTLINAEEAVALAGKAEEETCAVEHEPNVELELEQTKQEDTLEAEKEIATESLVTESTSNENVTENSPSEENKTEEAQQLVETTKPSASDKKEAQVSDQKEAQVSPETPEKIEPEAEACVEEEGLVSPVEAEKQIDVSEKEIETSQVAKTADEESNETTSHEEEVKKVEEEQPAPPRSRFRLWF